MSDDTPTGVLPTGGNDERFADDARRYRLDAHLATGGMGEVWRGTDTTLGRTVAVKLLKPEYAEDATFRRRFETEAQHAASLHHPGIAAVYDFGEGGSADAPGAARPFLVMELVEGQPLSALLRPGQPMDPEVASDLMAQTATALAAAHAAGIVHRDVKPANLLVTPDRRVKVTDFGIARAAEAVGVTQTGQVMGTPQYLSPEQARGQTATAASDVYALGVVAFECLAGRRPFQTDSPVTTALAHLNQPVPELPDAVPAPLAAVVRRALAKDPGERWPDASALAAAFRDPSGAAGVAADGAPTAVVDQPPSDSTRVLPAAGVAAGAGAGAAAGLAAGAAGATPAHGTPPPTGTTTTTTPTDGAGGAGGSGRSPWAIVLMVLLLAAVAALIIVLLVTGGDDEEPTQRPSREPSPTSSSAEPTPTEPTTAAPATVEISESDYTGRQVREVEADLRGQGLSVTLDELENDGTHEEGVVASVNPTGTVQEGDTITVGYWGAAPEPTPTEDPLPTAPTGSASQEPSDGPSDGASPSNGASQRPSEAAAGSPSGVPTQGATG